MNITKESVGRSYDMLRKIRKMTHDEAVFQVVADAILAQIAEANATIAGLSAFRAEKERLEALRTSLSEDCGNGMFRCLGCGTQTGAHDANCPVDLAFFNPEVLARQYIARQALAKEDKNLIFGVCARYVSAAATSEETCRWCASGQDRHAEWCPANGMLDIMLFLHDGDSCHRAALEAVLDRPKPTPVQIVEEVEHTCPVCMVSFPLLDVVGQTHCPHCGKTWGVPHA